MTDRRAERAFPNATAPLSPETLKQMIRIAKPDGIISVQGYAKNVSEPKTYGDGRPTVYGDLELGSALVPFAVPAEAAPQEDERVVIEGCLTVQLVTRSLSGVWRGNWNVRLIGQVVGTWIPSRPQKPLTPLPKRGERVSLDKFISEHGSESLLILATDVAEQDIRQSLVRSGVHVRPRFHKADFGNPDAFLKSVSEISTDADVAGLAVARGGGFGINEIGNSRDVVRALIEKPLPFYVALGHDTDITLLDKYADETFHSPSELGAAIDRSTRRAASEEEKTDRIRKLEAELTRRVALEQEEIDGIRQLEAELTRRIASDEEKTDRIRKFEEKLTQHTDLGADQVRKVSELEAALTQYTGSHADQVRKITELEAELMRHADLRADQVRKVSDLEAELKVKDAALKSRSAFLRNLLIGLAAVGFALLLSYLYGRSY